MPVTEFFTARFSSDGCPVIKPSNFRAMAAHNPAVSSINL